MSGVHISHPCAAPVIESVPGPVPVPKPVQASAPAPQPSAPYKTLEPYGGYDPKSASAGAAAPAPAVSAPKPATKPSPAPLLPAEALVSSVQLKAPAKTWQPPVVAYDPKSRTASAAAEVTAEELERKRGITCATPAIESVPAPLLRPAQASASASQASAISKTLPEEHPRALAEKWGYGPKSKSASTASPAASVPVPVTKPVTKPAPAPAPAPTLVQTRARWAESSTFALSSASIFSERVLNSVSCGSNSDGDDEPPQRHPLEVADTERFLAEDLRRRVRMAQAEMPPLTIEEKIALPGWMSWGRGSAPHGAAAPVGEAGAAQERVSFERTCRGRQQNQTRGSQLGSSATAAPVLLCTLHSGDSLSAGAHDAASPRRGLMSRAIRKIGKRLLPNLFMHGDSVSVAARPGKSAASNTTMTAQEQFQVEARFRDVRQHDC